MSQAPASDGFVERPGPGAGAGILRAPPPQAGLRSLTVFCDAIGDDTADWQSFVDDVGRVLRLTPVLVPVDMQAEEWVSRLLRAAVAAPGPVLVLPRAAGGAAAPGIEHPMRLTRVVLASGDAGDVVRSARYLSRHLRAGGIQTTVLVVLSDGALPPMWEGAGHHASAWYSELHRRHGMPDHLEVVPGVPGPGAAIRHHAEDTDLLVLLWRRVAAEGRAAIVRAVVGEPARVPSLLVPLAWVERMRDAAAPGPPARREVPAGR